jgi:inner membrane protein
MAGRWLVPSIISHSVVALAAGSVWAGGTMPVRFWLLSIICVVLPDADVVGFRFGINYGDFFGHRGFFHSLFFGALVGALVAGLFFRSPTTRPWRWWLVALYFSLLTASHGILDAFTSGGLGIALLSPFDATRYFFPWTPIRVSPIGIRAFMSAWGMKVMMNELLWIWLPAVSAAALVKASLVLAKAGNPEEH